MARASLLENILEGWIKLHRKFQKWEWRDSPKHVAVFMDILLEANYQDNKYRGDIVKAGSLTTSYNKISERTGVSIRGVRTVLKDLIATNEVTYTGMSRYSIISITNWSDHQGGDTQNDNETTIKRQSNDNQTTPNKKVNNTKKEKKERSIVCHLDPISIFNLWNHTCGEHLPMTKKLTASRKTNINATVKNIPGLDSIEGWKLYFLKILESDFLKGSTGWCATFDWAIKSSNALKVSENKYTNSGKTSQEQKQNKMLTMRNPYA